MAIQKNDIHKDTKKEEASTILARGLKINKTIFNETKKVGRKTINEDNLKADQRNTFLLNSIQQEKMEKRMAELGIRNKTDYIFKLLKQDISGL